MATDTRPNQSTGGKPQNAYQQLLEYGRSRGYKLDWLTARETFGSRVNSIVGEGVLLQDIDSGPFAQIPEWSDNMTGRPRGALVRPTAPKVGNYSVRTKSDIWLKNASQLYEEAVQRQWSSAVDIPWETLEELPDGIERG